jgi:NADPH:quinone reductase-like Zn-dependent oxidoreductase
MNTIPSMMKAAAYNEYGPPDVLRYTELPTPVPSRDEALVKVHAVGLNGYDLMARAGRYKPNKGKFPHVLGGDFGGELVALHVRSPARNPGDKLVGRAMR